MQTDGFLSLFRQIEDFQVMSRKASFWIDKL